MASSVFENKIPTSLCIGCDGRLDVVLVIESSHNIRSERYPLVLDLLASVVEQFEVSPNKTQFGAVIYSNAGLIEFNLKEYDNKHDVMTAVKRLPFLGGKTRVSNGLRLMVSHSPGLRRSLTFQGHCEEQWFSGSSITDSQASIG